MKDMCPLLAGSMLALVLVLAVPMGGCSNEPSERPAEMTNATALSIQEAAGESVGTRVRVTAEWGGSGSDAHTKTCFLKEPQAQEFEDRPNVSTITMWDRSELETHFRNVMPGEFVTVEGTVGEFNSVRGPLYLEDAIALE